MTEVLLTLNAGSSSIKFAVCGAEAALPVLAQGQVDGLGPDAHLKGRIGDAAFDHAISASTHAEGMAAILKALDPLLATHRVGAVGHRIVHGGPEIADPVVLSADLLDRLARYIPLAPLHQPHNLASVRAAQTIFPDAPQVGCFDTAFHRGHPWVNDTFALPTEYYDAGVRRYGFHGLSYDFITGQLEREEPEIWAGKVVVAHLGNGASMCAIRHGQSVGSTMGFSALDGLPMGTRCGQLDPGVVLYLMEHEGMDYAAITRLLYKESGLKGLSGMSHDMRTLEASDDPRAAQAIDYFVFRIRRELGAMAAILGGLDALVFTGGIGEHSALIRARVCHDMDWLGLDIDDARNAENARHIESSRVKVMVLPTDEEHVIAEATYRLTR